MKFLFSKACYISRQSLPLILSTQKYVVKNIIMKFNVFNFVHPPITHFLLGRTIFLSIFFPNCLNLFSSLKATDLVSGPYNTTDTETKYKFQFNRKMSAEDDLESSFELNAEAAPSLGFNPNKVAATLKVREQLFQATRNH
jgi:hypothetical protein